MSGSDHATLILELELLQQERTGNILKFRSTQIIRNFEIILIVDCKGTVGGIIH